MPIYSAKSDTQYAAPGPLPVPGPKLLRNCFTRLLFGGRVIFCCQAPWCLMLSIESMIAIPSRRGGGGRQTFPVPLSRKILRYLSFLSCSRDPGRAVEDAARGRETGGVRYGILRIATGAVRPRNDNPQEVWRGRTGSSAPTDAFRKCVGEGLCPSRGRGRTPPLRRTEKKCVIASAFT